MAATKQSQEQLAPPLIPDEWLAELALMPEGSPEREEYMAVLTEFGYDGGTEADEGLGEPPAGFSEWHYTGEQSTLPLVQFMGKVAALWHTEGENPKGALHTDVLAMTTDMGNVLHVCDLRPEMATSIHKLAPRTAAEQAKLDGSFYSDLKAYADAGVIRHHITDASKGIFYTRAGATSMRAFWTLLSDTNNPNGIRTIGRLADSGNNKGFEAKLYHRLFGVPLRND